MGGPRPRQHHRKGRERRSEASGEAKKIPQPVLNIPIYEILGEEGLEIIHKKTLEVLSEVGIAFYLDEAHDILRENGAKIDGDMVYFDPDLVMEYIAKAPNEFSQLARNPENNVKIGENHMVFAPVAGAPYIYDYKYGRRESTFEDFNNFLKLAYLNPYIHHSGGVSVEPNDLPLATRHLDVLYSHLVNSDKPFLGAVLSTSQAQDSIRMAEIVLGAEEIRKNPALMAIINVSSPRRLDTRMLEALTEYARAYQATVITPFILSGAMSAVSLSSTLIQGNAEALAGIVYSQMVAPGAPVIYGSFMTNVDLKSGSPVFGSPESQIALYASGQLARLYSLPFRCGGMYTSSKFIDAQSAYESVMNMLPAIQARSNYVLHAAGWLENGLSGSLEKFVLDCDVLGMMYKFMQGLDFSDIDTAIEMIADVEPGGHHLGTPITTELFTTAFYRSELFDYNDYGQWVEKGKKSAGDRAAEKVQKLLKEYQKPSIDAGIEEELKTFVAKRKEELAQVSLRD